MDKILAKADTLFRLPKFFPHVFFCSRIPSGHHITLTCRVSSFLLAVTVSRTFPAFEDLGCVEEDWTSV